MNPAAKKKKTIIPFKRSVSLDKRKHQLRRFAVSKVSVGLPAAPKPPPKETLVANETPGPCAEDDFQYCSHGDDEGSEDETMPCDYMLAIQELQRSKEGLAIPLVNDGGKVVHGILECQIQELFLQQHGTSKSLSREIEQALENNTLRKISSSNERCPDVYLTRDDYITAVRDALQHETALCDWFLEGLDQWSKSVLSRNALELSLQKTAAFRLCSSDKIQQLQEKRVLLSATSHHDEFKLFLPTWGDAVIPAFRKVLTDGVTFLKQAKQRKERSLSSFVNRLGRSPIPIARVLVPWMVAQGLVKRVQRPSGPFIALAD